MFVKEWWTREAGGREVLALALPLVISTCMWTIMNFTDRLFLLWYSNEAMAAALPAGLLHFTLLCFPLGLISFVNTFVAQYHGAGQPPRIAMIVWQGIWLSLLLAPLLLLTIPLAPTLFALAGHAPKIAAEEVTYFRCLAWGGGATLLSAAFSAFFTGRGETKIVMCVDAAATVINILLDYAWVFGRWGFPEWGIAGAAWATVVAQWCAVLMYWLLLEMPGHREPYRLRRIRPIDLPLMGRLIYYGGPNGMQMVIEVGSFTLFTFVVGWLGETALTATNLAFNINSLAWVPMMGMGLAVTTIVGQHLGRQRPDLAARATWTSLVIAMLYMGSIAATYVVAPGFYLLAHAAGSDPTRFGEIRDLTVMLLRFVAAYCMFDAMNVIFVGAIKGAGDTRFVLVTTIILAPLPFLLSWLGMRYANLGLMWCWTMVTAWVCLLGLIYCVRFLQGRWREMRVIEPHLA